MGERKDKLLGESTGKTISVYYNDTYNSVSLKIGKFLDFDEKNIKLLEECNGLVLIPKDKCIRIETREEKKVNRAEPSQEKANAETLQ